MKKILKKLIPKKLVNFYHFLQAVFSKIIFYHPKKVRFIGITGTDGKTTTTFLIFKILQAAGKKVAMCNGLVWQINDNINENPTDNTTPNAWLVYKFIKEAKAAGVDYIIIETTSWALDTYRVWGIPFTSAGISNVTLEHLDLHKNMESYRASKGKLFEVLKKNQNTVSVVNRDDPAYEFFKKFFATKKFSYGLNNNLGNNEEEQLTTIDIKLTEKGSEFILNYSGENYSVKLSLFGEYNISNAMLALALGLGEGIPLEISIPAISSYKGAAGRFEEIDCGQNFKIIIDFGHTPNAFTQVFTSIKKVYPESRIIAVFGAAGGRDKIKRPMLGEVAGEYADYVILTSDDPRYEEPAKIAEEIGLGLVKMGRRENQDFEFIENRKQAIFKALTLAKPKDIVIMLSMGPYTSMYVKEGKIPWSDKGAVEEYFKK